jgi:hypothetical protein
MSCGSAGSADSMPAWTYVDVVRHFKFKEYDPIHREQEHEVPRILFPVNEFGVAVQELCAEIAQG